MPRFHIISNSDPNVQEKVNYFIDRFQHMNIYAGIDCTLEIETPGSLLSKIYFNLTSGGNYKSDIFDAYFGHELFEDKELWKGISRYLKILELRNAFRLAQKKDRPKILDSSTFRSDLLLTIEELAHKFPDILFECLMRVVFCSSPLQDHNHIKILDEIAKLMVSEAYFGGKTTREIAELTDRIFNKELEKFPYPKTVRHRDKKRYLSENNLRNQLSGFKAIMERNNKTTLVLKKAFCSTLFPSTFEFKYDGVTFLGAQSKKIQQLKKQKEGDRNFEHFFKEGPHIYVLSKINYFSFESIHEHLRNVTRSQLNFLSAKAGSEVQLEQGTNFLLLSSKWEIIAFNVFISERKLSFSDQDVRNLSNNPFETLSKIKNSQSKDWFLKHEPLFVEVHKKKDISGYWKYLEALLPIDNDGGKQIKSLVPDLLLLNEALNTRYRVTTALLDGISFFSGGDRLFSIPLERLHHVEKSLIKHKIPKEIKFSQYAFARELVKDFNKENGPDDLRKAREYYRLLLIEAYNIRNFDVHSGLSNEFSNIKLSKVMPRLVMRLRWVILDGIKEFPDLPFRLLVDKLRKQFEVVVD